MNAALGIVGFIAFMAFGIAQLVAGFAGIEHGIGSVGRGLRYLLRLVSALRCQ